MKLAEIFCDHMVLQRDREICIFGSGKGKGSVEFCGTVTEFVSDSENFRVYIPAQSEGGPYDMKITLNGDTQVLEDILVGDVYIAAGQSNMALQLEKTSDIELTPCDKVRYFTESHLKCNFNGWRSCTDANALKMSAVAYYTAMRLHKHIGVPIGIVECSYGASRVDAWTAPEIVNTDTYQKWIEVRHPDYEKYKFNQAQWLYNNKLLLIVPYGACGVLWYQGESNRCHEEGMHYAAMFEEMVENWRTLWNYKLPFYCVQLMPYDEPAAAADWAVIREAQVQATRETEGVYLTTLVHTGESKLIHPVRKKTTARALASAVLASQFGEKVEYSGPIAKHVCTIENGVQIQFAHGDGLEIRGVYLEDTFVYDKDNVAYTVDAKTENCSLTLTWQTEIEPVCVKMGYCNNPKHNLYNAAGYLASPFCLKI